MMKCREAFYHPSCWFEINGGDPSASVKGWASLSAAEQAEVNSPSEKHEVLDEDAAKAVRAWFGSLARVRVLILIS